MFGEAYVFLLASIIPFIRWQQREEGRVVIASIITCIFFILWLLTNTLPVVDDTTTMIVCGFALWMIASMLWTHSRQSSNDLYMMLTCLTVFLVSRKIPLDILMPLLFVPGVVFAGVFLYYHITMKAFTCRDDLAKKWPIYGNSNHIGAFLIVPLFTGAWLTLNTSWAYAPFLIIVALAMVLNKCRAAQIGVIIGIIYIACTYTLWALSLLPLVFILGYLIYKNRQGLSNTHRVSILLAALTIIKRAPLAGYGLRTFRREYPGVIPDILQNTLFEKFFARGASVYSQTSHRVHNDYLEIIIELGLFGFILFISIFTSLLWADNSLLAGAIVAFAVNALFFFPLREAHTAFPFWALCGALAGTSLMAVQINPYLATVFMFIAGRIIWGLAVKLYGLAYYQQSSQIAVAPNAEDKVGKQALMAKQHYLTLAIQCDPYNNVYLTEGYYYNVFNNPELAFQYASRCMENYDGGKVKWGVCDQYARAIMRLGGFSVAKMALKYSIHICPDFKQSLDLLRQIEKMEAAQHGINR